MQKLFPLVILLFMLTACATDTNDGANDISIADICDDNSFVIPGRTPGESLEAVLEALEISLVEPKTDEHRIYGHPDINGNYKYYQYPEQYYDKLSAEKNDISILGIPARSSFLFSNDGYLAGIEYSLSLEGMSGAKTEKKITELYNELKAALGPPANNFTPIISAGIWSLNNDVGQLSVLAFSTLEDTSSGGIFEKSRTYVTISIYVDNEHVASASEFLASRLSA